MSSAAADHVIGLDVGGTSSRALLADLDGRRRGTGRAGGGNPVSRGVPMARVNVADATQAALGDVDPGRVGAVVMGIAGMSILDGELGGESFFDPVWRELGLTCPVRLVPDATVAFTSGTSRPNGTVLIAGTGAIACGFTDRELTRRSDGYGWLLGDLGSGFWLGKQAAYAMLQAADGIAPGGPLVDAVTAALAPDGDRPRSDQLVPAIMSREPIRLAELAPLVTRAAADADPVAERIVADAVAHLSDSIAAVRGPSGTDPIVIAGSLATAEPTVSGALRRRLRAGYPDADVRTGTDGAAGAAWLAARDLLADDSAAERLHAKLCGAER